MNNNDPLVGTTISQYRVLRHMARGGMADVYQAEDIILERPVVIKIILPHLAEDEVFVTRFLIEGQTTARIEHPNVIQIFTQGRLPDKRPYLVMRYIAGGSLQDRLVEMSSKDQSFAPVAALSLSRQVASALQVAHQAGIIHRDLKPSNILLKLDGAPVVTDLGIARHEGATRLTRTGAIMGTPYYMSPEQAKGERLDGRSDIYSLGVILHEMLSGAPPFSGDSPLAVLHQQIYEPPPPLAVLRPNLKPETIAVVDRALQKAPDERFQTASEMEAALGSALAVEMGAAPSAGAGGRYSALPPTQIFSAEQEKKKANRTWAFLLGILLIVSMCVILFWFNPDLLRFSNTAATPIVFDALLISPTEEPTETAVPPTSTPAPTNTIPPAPTDTPLPTQTQSRPQIQNTFSLGGGFDPNGHVELSTGSALPPGHVITGLAGRVNNDHFTTLRVKTASVNPEGRLVPSGWHFFGMRPGDETVTPEAQIEVGRQEVVVGFGMEIYKQRGGDTNLMQFVVFARRLDPETGQLIGDISAYVSDPNVTDGGRREVFKIPYDQVQHNRLVESLCSQPNQPESSYLLTNLGVRVSSGGLATMSIECGAIGRQ